MQTGPPLFTYGGWIRTAPSKIYDASSGNEAVTSAGGWEIVYMETGVVQISCDWAVYAI